MQNFYQSQKVRVSITACDPAQRKVHARFKDGGSTSIAVFEIGAAFRWPQVGEIWTVSRQNNFWILGSRVNDDGAEVFPVTTVSGNQVRLDGATVFDAFGNQGVFIGGPITISGALSSVTDVHARAVLSSIIGALTTLGLTTDTTT